MMRFQNLILQFPKRAQCHRAVYVRKYYWESAPFGMSSFAKGCTPTHPIGPCMVSHEGTCKIQFMSENRHNN